MKYRKYQYFFFGISYLIRAIWHAFIHAFIPKRDYYRLSIGASGSPAAVIRVNWEDCIGCKECEKACPARCISIATRTATVREDLGITSDGKQKSEWVLEFDIDMSKCLLCELCIAPCPTKCISMSSDAIDSVRERDMLIYHFTPFTPERAYQIARSGNGNRIN